MLIPFDKLHKKYDLKITGVLHVGAHQAEERDAYRSLGVHNIVWVEANRTLAKHLKSRRTDTVICAVVGDEDGTEVNFNIANNGQSSSILDLGTHKTQHPEVHYVSTDKRVTQRLDTIYEQHGLSELNFINLDIQGAELMALRGLGDRLAEFDYVYCEVNKEPLYVDCALIGDIDEFLVDFERVETVWDPHNWGDAFYRRVK